MPDTGSAPKDNAAPNLYDMCALPQGVKDMYETLFAAQARLMGLPAPLGARSGDKPDNATRADHTFHRYQTLRLFAHVPHDSGSRRYLV